MKNRTPYAILANRLLFCAILLTVYSWADTAQAQNNTIFGPNVYVFTPGTSVSTINSTLATLAGNAQFSTNRYAVFFAPGTYNGVESQVGYYMSVAGLGEEPTATAITNGYLTANTTDSNGNLTTNFWRSLENMEMSLPSSDVEQWGVSQGADFRRMDINDSVELTNTNCGEASGGFIADSVITGDIESCSQQQWYTRNSNFAGWTGNLWNMTFSGDNGAPTAAWGGGGNNYSVLATTPVVREKPFLYQDSSGNYWVFSPTLRTNSVGPSWTSANPGPGNSLAISTFFIATPSSTLSSINAALAAGQNLILTPGIYQYSGAINVTNPNTVVLGLGYADLVPQTGTAAITVADVDGVQLAGFLIDAGPVNSPVLLQVGVKGASRVSHASNPTSISDVNFRIGGATVGTATVATEIDSDNVIIDNMWSWRADHGAGAPGWTGNVALNGLVVNGDNVTALGLAVEHYEAEQVVWNGEGGETIFYQSEMPYDVPSQSAWMNGSLDGYASYNVAPSVTTHTAHGIGVYSYFDVTGVTILSNSGIAAPVASGVTFSDLVSVYLAGSGGITYTIASDSPGITDNAGTTAQSGSYISFVSSWGGTNGGCTAVPSVPGKPSGTGTSSSTISLTWSVSTAGSSCTVSYNLYRSTTSGFTPGSTNQIASGLTSASYADSGLAAATTYYYVVEAADGDGSSAASAQGSGTTLGGTCSAVPSAPTGLTATAESTSSIGLTWAAVTPPANCTVSSYTVFGGTTANPTTVIASGVTGTTYSNTGLAANTTYYYVVKAVDADGTSAASTQAQATTGTPSCTAVPSAPTGLTATASSPTAIGLSWSAVAPPANCSISSYSVYGSTTSGFTPGSGNLLSSSVTGTSYSNTGLSASTTYYYKVEAADADGSSAASAQASAATSPLPGPGVSIDAGGAAVSNSGGGDNSFVADEDYGAAGTTYAVTNTITIPASVAATAAPAAVYQSARQGTVTYTIPGLTAGSSYTVRLHFAELYFSAAGSREFNVAINGTTVLTNFDIYAAANARYTAVVEQYTATANSGGDIVIAFTNGAKDQPMINGLEVLGSSPSCTTVPPAPTGVKVSGATSSTLIVSWTAVTPPANCTTITYSVYASTTSGFTPGAGNLIASGVTGTSYTDTGLAASTIYYFVVEAVDAAGSSGTGTGPVNGETLANTSCTTVPSAPTGLTATASTSTAIGLSWQAVTPPANCSISSYAVYGGTTANPTTLIAGGLTGTTYSNTGLTASTNYYYIVKAVDADGTSAASAQASAETQPPSSGGYVSINAGGAAVSNSSGGDNSFVADENYSAGGTTYSVPNTITIPSSIAATAAPEAVYQDARQGAVTYTISGLTAGSSYIVRLHFAELYFSVAASRVFNVAINGTAVLTNFDIFATAGAQYTAVVKQFTEAANSSGDLVIAFTAVTDQPTINGIEVLDSAPCTTLPAAPTGLTATATYPSVVNLNWTAVTPPANCTITSYSVYGGSTANPTTLIGSGITGTTFSNTGLAASTTYYYVVKALDGGITGAYGTSAPSGQATTTTPAFSTIAPPTSLTAVGSSFQQIDLRWVASTVPAPNTDPVNYSVYRSTTTSFTPSSSNLMGTTVGITNYVDSNYPATLSPPAGPGVQASTTYYYKVVASTLSGESAAATASATSLPATPSTAAPAALTGLAAMAENANEIDLVWNSTNSGVGSVASTYYIYRSTTSPFTPSTSNEIGTTKSNWFQDALGTASTQYYYQVLASNTLGTSPSSATVTATTQALNQNLWGGAPFWDSSNMPALPAGDTVMMKFLNRTNGMFTDNQIIWTATINGVASQYTFAEQPTFAMPPNSSGRMYFFLNDPSLTEDNTDYWDYIEFTAGPTSINMDTTRVEALGVKVAFNLTCGDGTNIALGENQETFTEDRSVTFQRYADAVPSTSGGDFQADLVYAPYRIIEPGGAGFNAGGADQNYYQTFISDIWSFNGITIPLAGPNGSGLGANPDLSAAIFRHTAPISGTPEFNAAGALTNEGMWGNPASFYQLEPYDHYAQWIEAQAINMQQYAFPYNDAGGYSSDIGCANPKTLLVAVGW